MSGSVDPASSLSQIALGFGAACIIVIFHFATGACASPEESMDTLDMNTAYELSKEFKAPPEIVFRSFIDEETLKKIWGVSAIKIDARPEGKARAQLQIGNENWDFTITYKEVVPNEKLRWVVHFDRFPGKETRTTLLLTRVPAGTKLIFRQENFQTAQERDENRQAITEALKTLDGLLIEAKADH